LPLIVTALITNALELTSAIDEIGTIETVCIALWR
jgi:hypothetical protein